MIIIKNLQRLYRYLLIAMNDLAVLVFYNMICIAVIFLNGWWRCKYNNGNDILMSIKLGGDVDGWSLTHFLWFTFLGYKFPQLWKVSFLFGVGWEFIEHYIGESRPSWMGGFGDCNLGTDQLNSSHENWWYGRWTDIAANGLGLAFGYYLSTQLK